jgi:NitT/TauT family transport system permease protein
MMSISGGWFFIVASEAISVVGRDSDQYLPGVGAYIALAIQQADVPAMAYAGLALLALVLIYDQLIFRPIVAWAEKFKFEQSMAEETAQSWMLTLLQRARFVQRLAAWPGRLFARLARLGSRPDRVGPRLDATESARRQNPTADRIGSLAILAISLALSYVLARYTFGSDLGVVQGAILASNPNLNSTLDPDIATRFRDAGVTSAEDQTVFLSALCVASDAGTSASAELRDLLDDDSVRAPADLAAACAQPLAPAGKVALPEIGEVLLLGIFTMLRVVVMILLATLIWTPIGVWIGLRPRVAQFSQPIIQFAASFPANLLFPFAVVLITRFALNPEVWLAPLMVMGTQWYILFNVIAGTMSIPNDLKEAARVTGLRGWAWWRTLIIPGIFPSFVTGGITASGGSWNASIVAEVATWGSITLVASGLGAYIAHWSTGELNPHVTLGMLAMGLLVLSFNRLVWRRLYALAEERFRLD